MAALVSLLPVGAAAWARPPSAPEPIAQAAAAAATGQPIVTADPPVLFYAGLPDEHADPAYVYEVSQTPAQLTERYAQGAWLRAAYFRADCGDAEVSYSFSGKPMGAYASNTPLSDSGTYVFALTGYQTPDDENGPGKPWTVSVRFDSLADELKTSPVMAVDGGIPRYAPAPAAAAGGGAGAAQSPSARGVSVAQNPDGSTTLYLPEGYVRAEYRREKPDDQQPSSASGQPDAETSGGSATDAKRDGPETPASGAGEDAVGLPPDVHSWTFVVPGTYLVRVEYASSGSPGAAGTQADPAPLAYSQAIVVPAPDAPEPSPDPDGSANGSADGGQETYRGSPDAPAFAGVSPGGQTAGSVAVDSWPARTVFWAVSLNRQAYLGYSWGKTFSSPGDYELTMTLAGDWQTQSASFRILGRGAQPDQQTRQKNTVGMRDAFITGGILALVGVCGGVLYAKTKRRRRRRP